MEFLVLCLYLGIGFMIGFLVCFRWYQKEFHEASKTYDKALALHEEIQEILKRSKE